MNSELSTTENVKTGEKLTKTLHFHGAYTFHSGEKSLFHSAYVRNEGIYIWTIKDEINKRNLVHYVGETTEFGKRQREHLIQIMGLNYRIIDPTAARQGREEIIWNGMWRDKTNDAAGKLLDNYDVVSKKVKEYIGLINVYFAPTAFTMDLRRHIEGCIGWNLRNKYPQAKTFYPDDNHVGTKSEKMGETIKIILDEPIEGIEGELLI